MDIYHGELKNGLYHGFGILIKPSGTTYEGYFIEGFMHGAFVVSKVTAEKNQTAIVYMERGVIKNENREK
jgi:hypothetical protein